MFLLKKNLLLILCFFSNLCFSKIYINIDSPKVEKSIIALSPFISKNTTTQKGDLKLEKNLNKDLHTNIKFSSYFKILSKKAFIENPLEVSSRPYPEDARGFRWKNWKLSGADFLLFGSYSTENSRLILDISFYNINSQKKVFQKRYQAKKSKAKSLIDTLSNDIVEKLSGKKGIFKTKIASIRNVSRSKKELFLMNWDGRQKERLSYHRSIVLSPSWSKDGKNISYTAFVYNTKLKRRMTALFLLNLSSNKIKLLSNRKGANLGADFFPNRKDMLITLSSGIGFMDIFKINLSSLSIKPITKGPPGIINVEPSIHPKKKWIAFSSDRNGKTMIYTMKAAGSEIKQITFAGHHNSTPDWNPQNDEIVFSGQSNKRFDLFTVRSNGTGLRRLTSLKRSNGTWANCESPSFSPDGRFIVFTSDLSGTYQLYIMNVDDLSIERITFDRYNYKSPKWSPYL
ncbi:MAG: hypothetical protein ACR2M7_03375 [Bdellovibrionales bacterium]